MKYFLYRFNGKTYYDTECYYIDIPHFECNHYFGNMSIGNINCSLSLDLEKIDFDKIDSILTKQDFIFLDKQFKKLNDLGYGLEKDSKEYLKGMEIISSLKATIYSKLESKENAELFAEIVEQEKKAVYQHYATPYMTETDINEIFEFFESNTDYGYLDRGIIENIYRDVESFGREEFERYVDTSAEGMDFVRDFVDFESFGEYLINNGALACELDNGIVCSFYQ